MGETRTSLILTKEGYKKGSGEKLAVLEQHQRGELKLINKGLSLLDKDFALLDQIRTSFKVDLFLNAFSIDVPLFVVKRRWYGKVLYLDELIIRQGVIQVVAGKLERRTQRADAFWRDFVKL